MKIRNVTTKDKNGFNCRRFVRNEFRKYKFSLRNPTKFRQYKNFSDWLIG